MPWLTRHALFRNLAIVNLFLKSCMANQTVYETLLGLTISVNSEKKIKLKDIVKACLYLRFCALRLTSWSTY